VDTNVTGDIWAAGDTIHIDDIDKTQDSEERTIAGGGISSTEITVTAGLTNAKLQGAYVHLITRNVKFIGLGQNLLINFTSGQLTLAGGQYTAPAKIIINGSTGVAISAGTYYGSATATTNTNSTISGGVFSGNSAVVADTGSTISGGMFTGFVNGINGTGNSMTGGTVSGGYYGGGGKGCTISGGTFTYCLNGLGGAGNGAVGLRLLGGTISNNTSGIANSSAIIRGATFSNNTRDIEASIIDAYNASFGSATENYLYGNLSRETYSESYDHDQTAGAFRAWTKGGVTSSVATPVPTGFTKAYQTVLESATSEGWWQKVYTVGPGASLNIEMHLRKTASMTYLPRCIIFNRASTDPFAGGAGLHTFTMTNSVDTYETESWIYTNSGTEDVTIVIRFLGENATGSMYSALKVTQINVDLTILTANVAVIDALIDAMNVELLNLPAFIMSK
jgi:hypothetical protein